ncbi:formate dehydrogenase accessory protein FdhE [bacterium]|nr:MAG: formate dehydrogenase accessory protein FdhE [bacterium]
MSLLATAAEPWTDRRRRTAELRRRQPFAGELLDLYGALLPVQEQAYVEASAAPPAPDDLAVYAAELVVPGVHEVSLAAGPDRLRRALVRRLEQEHPVNILGAWIRGEEQSVVDRYIARASLTPVFEALGPEAGAACAGSRDPRHCPHCGGSPQLSYFAVAGEDLATGPRYLLCARCHSSWGCARMTCAGCGEDSSVRLPILSEEGTTSGERGSIVRGLPAGPANGRSAVETVLFPHIRVEACETCRQYLLSIDLASDPSAVPLVDELAAIPLDLVARERGFSKILPNLMGF